MRKRADFLAARSGSRVHTTAFVLQMRPNAHGAGSLRVGFTVTKKLGNAVVRNRIRRRLREAVRLAAIPPQTAGHDAVFIARAEAATIPFPALVADVERALAKGCRAGQKRDRAAEGAGRAGRRKDRRREGLKKHRAVPTGS